MDDLNFIALGISWYLVFVVSTTLHEAAHAYAAMKLGDMTAYLGGQVSLNPAPHMQREPLGMIGIPIISYIMAGWPMGWASAPYSAHWADRYPKKAALMALAGPVSNLCLAMLAFLFIQLGVQLGVFHAPDRIRSVVEIVAAIDQPLYKAMATTLSMFFFLNILLFLFNLIPFPPLDGSSVIKLGMSEDAARQYQRAMSDPNYSLFGLLVAWIFFDAFVSKNLFWICVKVLYPDLTYS